MEKHFLEECEREPLHLSNAIQAHGTLLHADGNGTVTHGAANTAAFLGKPPETWIGKPLPEDLAVLAAGVPGIPGASRLWEGVATGTAGPLDLVATRGNQGSIALEFLPHLDDPAPAVTRTSRLAIDPPKDEASLSAAQEALVRRVMELTGLNRVVYYAFREDGDGVVLAEALNDQALERYLGLRFPASDIPRIARTLYLKNPWRHIPDSEAEPVPLVGASSIVPDLTWIDLRSVSPVHRIYLHNMGVKTTASFPVAVGGQLQALVTAASHDKPRRLPLPLLDEVSALVRSHAISIASYQAEKNMHLVARLSGHFEPVQDLLRQRAGDAVAAWPELAPWLMREFEADGIHLCLGDVNLFAGKGFAPEALAALDAWFCGNPAGPIWKTDTLSRELPGLPFSEVAGVLALRGTLASGRTLRLYLARGEYIHHVAWGGNPNKPPLRHDGVFGIAPRRSFEKWIEKRTGYSQPWSEEAYLQGMKLREILQQEVRA